MSRLFSERALEDSSAIFFFFFNKILNSLPHKASLKAQLVKKPSAMQETPVQFQGREDPL